MSLQAARAYKSVTVNTASPVRVLDETYSRLMLDLNEAALRIKKGDIAGKGQALSHAMALVNALNAALEHNRAPELCSNLSRLYAFVHERIVSANADMNVTSIEQAERIVAELQDSFRSAANEAASAA